MSRRSVADPPIRKPPLYPSELRGQPSDAPPNSHEKPALAHEIPTTSEAQPAPYSGSTQAAPLNARAAVKGSIYARGNKLWLAYYDAMGRRQQRSSGLSVGQETQAHELLAALNRGEALVGLPRRLPRTHVRRRVSAIQVFGERRFGVVP